MAYIIGLLSPEEEAELKRRGWTVELAPNVDFDTGNSSHLPHRMRMVWIDQDMFTIMDGPDWDKGSPAADFAQKETYLRPDITQKPDCSIENPCQSCLKAEQERETRNANLTPS